MCPKNILYKINPLVVSFPEKMLVTESTLTTFFLTQYHNASTTSVLSQGNPGLPCMRRRARLFRLSGLALLLTESSLEETGELVLGILRSWWGITPSVRSFVECVFVKVYANIRFVCFPTNAINIAEAMNLWPLVRREVLQASSLIQLASSSFHSPWSEVVSAA